MFTSISNGMSFVMSILHDKARDNYELAKTASSTKKSNVAVSRYYYSIYEIMIEYLSHKLSPSLVPGNHHDTITFFLQHIKNEPNYNAQYSTTLSYITTIKRSRTKADYSPKFCYVSRSRDFADIETKVKEVYKVLSNFNGLIPQGLVI